MSTTTTVAVTDWLVHTCLTTWLQAYRPLAHLGHQLAALPPIEQPADIDRVTPIVRDIHTITDHVRAALEHAVGIGTPTQSTAMDTGSAASGGPAAIDVICAEVDEAGEELRQQAWEAAGWVAQAMALGAALPPAPGTNYQYQLDKTTPVVEASARRLLDRIAASV